MDLYPRDNKFNHAAVFPLVGRSNIKGKIVLPAAAMVVNMNRGDTPKDSLLNHY
jgi:Zn-dependent oligopeptidase